MKVDREQFIDQGYLILRDVIPPAKLEELRATNEVLVERQRAVWSRDRAPGDPPGGVWESAPQPRLGLHNSPELIDEKTADAVEFWLHENTLGVSAQLIGRPETAVNEMMMMCNPVRDHGPAEWHRDIHPIDTAPLEGYVGDFLDNGPRQVQWNIPMYDDDVLWVMPGSHCRLNTDEENAQLLDNPRGPLKGALTVELGAGDGVVYASPMILHWASNYSSNLRRTLHGTYGIHTIYADLSYTEHLSEPARAMFQRWEERSASMKDLTESVLRAAIQRDAQGFRDNMEQLRPGASERGKMLFTVYLAKAACHIFYHKHPERDDIPADLRSRGQGPHATTLNWGPQIRRPFLPRRGRCSLAALQASRRPAPGRRRAFLARVPIRTDALLLQRDAGRLRDGRLHSELELRRDSAAGGPPATGDGGRATIGAPLMQLGVLS